MNNNVNDCITELLDNYDLSYLLAMARTDDGGYTIYDDGSDFSVDCIDDALACILSDNS